MTAMMENGQRQLTIYSNKMSNMTNPVAMVLPVPVDKTQPNAGIKYYDLSKHTDLFEKLDDLWPKITTNSYGLEATTYRSSNQTLEVRQIGSYKVSLAPDLSAIRLLNTTVFKLDSLLAKILSQYYSNYGFLVCQMDRDAEFHPFAYSHPVPANSRGKLFVPTRHQHGTNMAEEEHDPDWDHSIYVANTSTFIRHPGVHSDDLVNQFYDGLPRLNTLLAELPFNIDQVKNMRRFKIDETFHQNYDLIMSVI